LQNYNTAADNDNNNYNYNYNYYDYDDYSCLLNLSFCRVP
jgi:hypothetical protein